MLSRADRRQTASRRTWRRTADLDTLVQELEDTYGVSMSDEQAAAILTVGGAVESSSSDGSADAQR